jgi:hypothetical protein
MPISTNRSATRRANAIIAAGIAWLAVWGPTLWPHAWSWRIDGWMALLAALVLTDLRERQVPWRLLGATAGWSLLTRWTNPAVPHPLAAVLWPFGLVIGSIGLHSWRRWPLGGGDMKWLMALAWGLSPWGLWLWWVCASLIIAGAGQAVIRRWYHPPAWPFLPWASGVLVGGWMLLH